MRSSPDNTSDTRCVVFPNTNTNQFPLSWSPTGSQTIQFSLTLAPGVRTGTIGYGSVSQDSPTSDASCTSLGATCTCDWPAKTSGVPLSPSPGMAICWNDSQNSGKHFTFLYTFTHIFSIPFPHSHSLSFSKLNK